MGSLLYDRCKSSLSTSRGVNGSGSDRGHAWPKSFESKPESSLTPNLYLKASPEPDPNSMAKARVRSEQSVFYGNGLVMAFQMHHLGKDMGM
ncbi:hypothetical protein AMTR_s00152p00067310 [Amborella trichopoda]|uniref:Uncharacterized protein n=1 Tax=Amborella trichopoda TaxID=13333 RepID=W1PLD8_AMBTC|nr:hypothetical protein AMTR_s00152p00067310 [Amborella trichopoda]